MLGDPTDGDMDAAMPPMPPMLAHDATIDTLRATEGGNEADQDDSSDSELSRKESDFEGDGDPGEWEGESEPSQQYFHDPGEVPVYHIAM